MKSGSAWRRDGGLDRLAIGLSGLCAVHCLASAVLLAVLSSAGALLDPRIHEVGLVLAILLGGLALGRGVRHHGRRGPLLLGAGGLALMALGLVLPHGAPEIVATLSGVALLAGAHQLNRHAHG